MTGKLVNKTSVIDYITVDNIKKFTSSKNGGQTNCTIQIQSRCTLALVDPGGALEARAPLTSRFGGPSVQFKSKTMNFKALIIYFFKKFSASLRSA